MIYPIDYTNTESVINSLDAALDDAGVIQTRHYKSASDLIVTLTRSSRVFRINVPSQMRLYIYYGTAYVSGTTISDSITISLITTGTSVSGCVAITGDVIAFAEYRGATVIAGALIGAINNEDETEIAWGWSSPSSAPLLHNTESRTQMHPNIYPKALISTDGKYYMSDIVCMDSAYTLMGVGVKGVKALHRPANTGMAYEIVGNDVIIPGGQANGDASIIPNSLYIPNAVTWEPA